jgi:folate-dependent phosphoribosylglycinamide formyltransferase PurN
MTSRVPAPPWRLKSLRSLCGQAWHTRAWRPDHARLLWFQVAHRNRNRDVGLSDADHLVAAARWLARAQDVMQDGGVCGRYELAGGWTSSYPETTGYIVPTFLSLAQELGDDTFRARAARCIRFLLSLQLPGGAFPGGEVAENTTDPSVFNTAQIVSGLAAWYRLSADPQSLQAARRAADWLIGVQDADGAWRRYVYQGIATTYSAFASCWLADLGSLLREQRYLDAAARHVEWALQQWDPETGWFDLAGFSAADHRDRVAVTHTIAYTLWGVLQTSEIVGSDRGVVAVTRAALGIARRLELSGWLPGVLDHRWRGRAPYGCLTGNAQLALIWLRLYERHRGGVVLLNAALKALDLVKRAQPMFARDPNIRGGVPGSDPVWGAYLANALPNWAVKFFIDALLAKRRVLAGVRADHAGSWAIAPDVPRSLPDAPPGDGRQPLRVVMYSAPGSHKVPQMITSWARFGFRPTAVVFERGAPERYIDRIVNRIRERGLRSLVARALWRGRPSASPRPASAEPAWPDAVTYCRSHDIPVIEVAALDSPEGRAAVTALRPDLAIHAGAGILRAPLLALPRLGTLNAHMGILPRYRGMNVAEWARFNGDAVGCTVHLMDPGIDTGDILCIREVGTDGATSISELRDRVDRAQITLLGDVLDFIARTGTLPPARSQRPDEGTQFFRMHPELAGVLEAELRSDVQRQVGAGEIDPPAGPA